MLKIDYSLFVQIANFLFLLFILNIILYRPIRRILNRRREEMDTAVDRIGDFLNRSERYESEFEENVVDARREGHRAKEDIRADGLNEEKTMIQDAASQAGEKIAEAKREIDLKVADVRQSLQNEVAQFSRELAEKMLGRSL